jgi:hypothetical protein
MGGMAVTLALASARQSHTEGSAHIDVAGSLCSAGDINAGGSN